MSETYGTDSAEALVEAAKIGQFAPRFWPRVNVGSSSECWPWTGTTLPFGYGSIESPAGKTAHRYAWASANGRLPRKGEVVRHRCDNPPCCNPAHLEIGTQRQNVEDMISRGRTGFTATTCRAGHERTPENTLLLKNGDRRCKTCERAQERERRKNAPRYRCPKCEHAANLHNLVRHLNRLHGEVWLTADLRLRAALAEEGDR